MEVIFLEDKTFELVEKMYSEMINGFKEVKSEISELKSELREVKDRVITIENDHGKKLAALFDGHLQNTQQLDRIEEEVSKHEDIILRRVK